MLVLALLLISSTNASILSGLLNERSSSNSDSPSGNVSVDDTTIAEINRMKVNSAIAYCPVNVTNFQCGPICEQDEVKGTTQSVEILSKSKKTTGFVAFNNEINSIIVSFKGSNNQKNFLADFVALPVKSKFSTITGLRVHFGFQSSYLSIRDGIMAQLRSLIAEHATATIRITGHSLGAAMASLCVLDMLKNLPDKLAVTSLYTYGQPRVGNEIFARAIESALAGRIFRVTHLHDLVTNVPTFKLFNGDWTHHTTEYHVSENNSFKFCDGREDPACSVREFLKNAKTLSEILRLVGNTIQDMEAHTLKTYTGSVVLECSQNPKGKSVKK